ncbi:hypothetical protein IG631_09169 [Alternaria alternata]|nr:hypothetical protein IG631_09169 [Alternaria alternata]
MDPGTPCIPTAKEGCLGRIRLTALKLERSQSSTQPSPAVMRVTASQLPGLARCSEPLLNPSNAALPAFTITDPAFRKMQPSVTLGTASQDLP